jgi:protein-tyrosine phosphatase
MRPGLFDNERADLERAYEAMRPHLAAARAQGAALPDVYLSSEHYVDDVVWGRLTRGEALPYPALDGALPTANEPTRRQRAALVEFHSQAFPLRIAERLVDLRRCGLRVVVAHPERYRPVWDDDSCLDPLLDAGAVLLLDVCALVGKYGRRAQAAAEKLLAEEAYEAACSDAHRPSDIAEVGRALARLEALAGAKEAFRLLAEGPGALLRGA